MDGGRHKTSECLESYGGGWRRREIHSSSSQVCPIRS
jgi:hypothetical protein